MKEPYSVLGVLPTATDEEIARAYRELAKKYHPDNYTDSPLADFATEKMQEINEAYDYIRKQRREQGSTYGNGYSASSYAGYSNSRYHDVRMMIKNGRIADADQILSGVPNSDRSAEWYFLKGTILYRKGWTEHANSYFQQAYDMEPTNNEYRAAYHQMREKRKGEYGGYNHTKPKDIGGGCTNCDCCTALCCADCCCECIGSDLISCC